MMKKSEVAVCGLSLAALLFFVNPPALAQSALLQINAGGPAVSPFVADEDFSGGATIDHANTINTSKVTNPAPAAVYQTARVATTTAGPGPTYTYTIGGFTAGTSYLVRLHFCETYFSTAGSAHVRREHQRHAGLDELRYRHDRGRPEHREHPAIHGARKLQRAIRDRVHVRDEQRPHQRDRN